MYDWVPEFCHTCLQVGHKCNSGKQLGHKPRPKHLKQKHEWQHKAVPNVKEAQAPIADNSQSEVAITTAGKNASNNLESSNARLARGGEEQAWKKIIGKSVAKSKDRQAADAVNMINGFNILTESGLQLTLPRQRKKEQVGREVTEERMGLHNPSLYLYEACCMEY